MRIVLQRVSEAAVSIGGEIHASIKQGYLILLGIEHADSEADADWLIQKIAKLRIFNDAEGKMNLSIVDCQGEFLVVSQFTLHASCKKGNRPSFIQAARPEIAIPLYVYFNQKLQETTQLNLKTGVFGADMQVRMCNDGPVTILLDSKEKA